jgi:hypothetical protein
MFERVAFLLSHLNRFSATARRALGCDIAPGCRGRRPEGVGAEDVSKNFKKIRDWQRLVWAFKHSLKTSSQI